jgi:hypothetical protein
MRTLAVLAVALALGACSTFEGVYPGMPGDGAAFNVQCRDAYGRVTTKTALRETCRKVAVASK